MFPFLCDYQRVWQLDLAVNAYQELRDYFRRFDPCHQREGEVFTRLGYIDVQHLAPRIRARTMMGVGLIAAAYEYAFAYAQKRQAFGGPISRFQSLQHYLADMYINLENARNITYKSAWLCDNGLPYHLEATMAKLVASEGALHAGRFGAEILGGYGICMEYPMQRYLRDAYQLQFSPISNEMSKNMMMQFQGLPKSWA